MFRPTTSEDYTHIYSGDPAVDQKASGFDHEKWVETGDPAFLPCRPGCEPVRFKLRHLRGRAKAYLSDRMINEGADKRISHTLLEAVAVAVVDIENGQFDDGAELQPSFIVDRKDRIRRLTDETLDVLYDLDGGALIAELGNRIVRESFSNPT